MKKIFSLTKKDFIRQTFRSGGKGGQNQNKVESGVRFIHEASGARGESREYREQIRNERMAFERLVNTEVFKKWVKVECSRRLGESRPLSPEEVMEKVDREIKNNCKVEIYTPLDNN